MNDLIPIEYKVSSKIKDSISLIELYKSAGMTRMVRELQFQLFNYICECNDIEIVHKYGSQVFGERRDFKAIPIWDFTEPVPVDILKKIATIPRKGRLYIMVPHNNPDPILIYDTGLLDDRNCNMCIVLAIWGE